MTMLQLKDLVFLQSVGLRVAACGVIWETKRPRDEGTLKLTFKNNTPGRIVNLLRSITRFLSSFKMLYRNE